MIEFPRPATYGPSNSICSVLRKLWSLVAWALGADPGLLSPGEEAALAEATRRVDSTVECVSTLKKVVPDQMRRPMT